jgi:hypothetical protein
MSQCDPLRSAHAKRGVQPASERTAAMHADFLCHELPAEQRASLACVRVKRGAQQPHVSGAPSAASMPQRAWP